MRQIVFEPTFEGWRKAARGLLNDACPPTEIDWIEAGGEQAALGFRDLNLAAESTANFRIPRQFISMARTVSLHSDARKWSLLYRALWRLTHGEADLFKNPIDADVVALTHLQREVSKDAYRMRAFLRFRETQLNGETWFVAWYEPEHDTVALNEEFFTARFGNMKWSILTPKCCMHWDGREISFSAGASGHSVNGDAVEPLWIAYYSNIFNPARLKPAAMQAQLLKRNWKNLPEAAVIEPLLREARRRTDEMVERSEFHRDDDGPWLATPPRGKELNWESFDAAAKACRACPLWKTASCVVLGEGPRTAKIVLVGEQPGDQEDRACRPFVGPAGQVLDRALAAAGISREDVFITNAVKHFKFEPRGKRRIHKTASPREIAACRPWLEAELTLLQPGMIVALGSTAARSLFASSIKVTEDRGKILPGDFGPTLVTAHPSSLLRLRDENSFEPEFAKMVADLKVLRSNAQPHRL